MPSPPDELLQRLRATFRGEAQEHVQAIAAGLVALELPGSAESHVVLDTVFRAAHSLKGAARAVNVGPVESLCQALESVFATLKRRSAAPAGELFDLLHRAVDLLSQMLETLDSPAAVPPSSAAVAELRRALHVAAGTAGGASAGGGTNAAPAAQADPAPGSGAVAPGRPARMRPLPDSVRVVRRSLDSALLQAEELLHAGASTAQRAAALRGLWQRSASWLAKSRRARNDARAVEGVLAEFARSVAHGRSEPALAAWARLKAQMEDSRDFVASLESDLLRQSRLAEQDQRAIGSMVDHLLDHMKQLVVQPFSAVLDLFPSSARELARDQGKEIDLEIVGGEIAIDRRILEGMKDPLIHLVRNGIDHGIEPPTVRRAKGKPARGRITIAVSQRDGNEVDIVLSDDGAGLDVEALQHAGAKSGLPMPADIDAAGAREALLALAFEPGVSTTRLITDVSGRGLGLAIVKEHVERLTGSIAVSSQPGAGTSFRITLPLTLARFRGVVVRAGGQNFVLPTRFVERVARVAPDQVKTVEVRPTVSIGGRVLALVELSAVLGLPDATQAMRAIVLLGDGASGHTIAFGVDEVVEEREVLVKPLGAQLEGLRNMAGATVLGTGQVVPVLHVPDVMRNAVSAACATTVRPAVPPARAAAPKSVLVAEDSITSRTLLKSILEGAGYRVQTAADGVDAFTALRSGAFDIVVSDVDMPRLNGFGLTARIRADQRLAELPVVLVTALDSREDREHGVGVGASAYIVKSDFDQGGLLDIVRRLA